MSISSQVVKREYKYFKKPYYSTCQTDWQNCDKVDFAAGDTETHLYYDNKLLSEAEAEQLMRENGQSWCRANIQVVAWAYLLYTDKGFYCFQDIEDYLLALASLRCKVVVWYNAKFDFPIFDSYFLNNNWTLAQEAYQNGVRGHYEHGTYSSLQNDMGARYQLKIWNYYYRKGQYRVHGIKFIDLLNVMQGGLKANLKSWNVVDDNGEPIRKLEMDYVNDSIDECVNYLINDVRGLYYLTLMFDKQMDELSGLSLIRGDFMTSGGLAKKIMLTKMYNTDYKTSIKMFHEEFYMDKDMDKMFRDGHLYQGGKTLVNNHYKYKIVHNVYKLDENSMYPHKERTMPLPKGKPEMKYEYDETDNRIKILHIKWASGTLKPNMIGIWYDLTEKEYVDVIDEQNAFFIFEDEWNELANWYYLYYEIDYVLYYETTENQGLKDFIDEFYDIKCKSKGAKKLAVKIPLNASYGKLAERVERVNGHYELADEGYVHYVRDGIELDTKNMLSVVLGALVTSLARVDLMQKIREFCGGDPYNNFIYCDTDSIHTLTCYGETDNKKLGMMKNEAPDGGTYRDCYYLAPKTYLMIHNDYYTDKRYIDGEPNTDALVVHCKGVNTNQLRKQLMQFETIEDMLQVFRPNYPIRCLTGINALGGKALIYKEKYILRDDDWDNGDNTNGDGLIFYEL